MDVLGRVVLSDVVFEDVFEGFTADCGRVDTFDTGNSFDCNGEVTGDCQSHTSSKNVVMTLAEFRSDAREKFSSRL